MTYEEHKANVEKAVTLFRQTLDDAYVSGVVHVNWGSLDVCREANTLFPELTFSLTEGGDGMAERLKNAILSARQGVLDALKDAGRDHYIFEVAYSGEVGQPRSAIDMQSLPSNPNHMPY